MILNNVDFFSGVLVEAMRKGHWIILDELNLAPTDVLEALNRVRLILHQSRGSQQGKANSTPV